MNVLLERQAVILIVDDTPANLNVLSDVLDEAGFEVLVAQSGEAALARVQAAIPDLILLDVMMPGIDGFETCRELKANPVTQDIPIIFMTALSDTTNKVTGLNLGAVDYITKPFQQEEVLARVQLHLQLHFLTQQLAEQNLRLEQRVEERTAALKQALLDLQQAQVQIIQSEKMSSLGQLVAGVAHEINNPVNFICGNLNHADEYTQHLLEVVQLYQTHYPHPPSEIAAKLEDFEVSFLLEDLPKLLRSMQVGAERIQEIVRGLRHFSRMDEAEFKSVDLHTGIESTLMILQNRLKARGNRPKIQVISEYGALPLVECYPGALNQVFMNLLSNAIDALEEAGFDSQIPPTLWIQTERIDADWVAIHIRDNGSGMTEEVQANLFHPFFTTKPVGKGTGMGLAISHSIVVEQHKGQLYCLSQPGKGSEFVIKLPIQHAISATAATQAATNLPVSTLPC